MENFDLELAILNSILSILFCLILFLVKFYLIFNFIFLILCLKCSVCDGDGQPRSVLIKDLALPPPGLLPHICYCKLCSLSISQGTGTRIYLEQSKCNVLFSTSIPFMTVIVICSQSVVLPSIPDKM